jgi:hypothetical protein
MTIEIFALHPNGRSAPTIEMLYERCPTDFKRSANPWRELAKQMRVARGADRTNWRPNYKIDETMRKHLMDWFVWVTIESTSV